MLKFAAATTTPICEITRNETEESLTSLDDVRCRKEGYYVV